ncbi:hypothetical protein ACHAXA_006193 [Cyclostephanos tholiformis]|uniref:Uncharacterized protein n=1 Tax=Cyclostephanos tholiformis TaxID=382380 RepID=A0ABD3RTD7_9STRA
MIAPPLEMLIEDGYYDELSSVVPSLHPPAPYSFSDIVTSNNSKSNNNNNSNNNSNNNNIDNDVARANPPPPPPYLPPPSSRGAADKGMGFGGGGGGAVGMGGGTVGEEDAERAMLNRQLPPSAGATPPPPPPPPAAAAVAAAATTTTAANVANNGVDHPSTRMGSGVGATTVPIATATLLVGNMSRSWEVAPMTTIHAPAPAPNMATTRNVDVEVGGREGGGEGGGDAGESGTSVALPVWLVRRMKYGMIGLALLLLAAVGAIIAMVAVDDPVVITTTSTTTSSTAIANDIIDASTIATSTLASTSGASTTSTSGAAASTATSTEATNVSTSTTSATTTTSRTTTTTSTTASTTRSTTTTPFIDTSSAWKQRGSPIVGDASDARFGRSVALSSDASALAIGAPDHNDNTGYVKIYRVDDDGGGYSVQIGQTLNGDATYDNFGYSMDMTPDGTTVICGSPVYSDVPGYVRVYSLEGDIDLGTDNWKQIGQDIVGEANGDEFGISVSISEDGKTIAIGAPLNDGSNGANSGRVRMYRLSDDGTTWVKIGQDIDGTAAYHVFGRSVSLSADGSTVAIGASGHHSNGNEESGRVNVYRINVSGSSWEPLGQSIDGVNDYDHFGVSVSLTPDGNTLAIGTFGCCGGGNYVKVFSLSSDNAADTWNQFGQVVVGGGGSKSFGYSVSLSDYGRTLAVGAPYLDGKNGEDSGIVRIYRMSDAETKWILMGDDIDGAAAGDWSGYSVSLSADGTKVAIGSPYTPYNGDNGDYSGHVRVFAWD